MSYIVGLRLTNFMIYRGLTELELEPKPYAIVAERDGDTDSSNWCGKSTLTWAIRFALTGQHPKRTEDAWITDGEKDGGVDIELSDGTFISRTRTRGKSTQLHVVYRTTGDEEREAHGADAEEVLARVLGFTDRDAEATWWVGQGSMDRLLNPKKVLPSELSEIVNGWLELGPLDDAYEHTLGKLRELERERANIQTRLSVLRESHRPTHEIAANRPVIVDRIAALEAVVAATGGDGLVERWRVWERDRQAHERSERLKAERALKAANRLPTPDPKSYDGAGKVLDELKGLLGDATTDLRNKRNLATGKFDGRCPVGGVQCPIADKLNSATAFNEKLLLAAETKQAAAERAWSEQFATVRRLTEQRNAFDARARELAALDTQIATEKPASDRFLASEEPPDPTRVQAAAVELEAARGALRQIDEAVARAESEAAHVATYEARLAELSVLVQARREALQIFGRNGAPRRIAEAALEQVEHAANAAMVRCGIDLRVTVEWAREGKQLSTNCYSCGAVFGKSQKFKACQECGAERGPQLEERLAIRSSADSGGALDLAGAMLQPAIARWLRQRRGYSWGVIVLDEPLGQLDRRNRAAFATKLAGALRTEFCAEQCFLVSHDTMSIDAMPNRIKVTASANGSTAIVES